MNGDLLLTSDAAVVDDRVLLDAPPAVMATLDAQGKDVTRLEVAFISTLGGDATFGLPFLLRERVRRGCRTPLWIVGPRGLRDYCLRQLAIAFPGESERISAAACWEEVGSDFSRNHRVAYHAEERGRSWAYRMMVNGRVVSWSRMPAGVRVQVA